ncbi:MAG: hypothetical protein JNN08_14500 [Bryobacterales bacterium]|nr:hypothetical protein [Bryobacterales bacterium]
MNSDQLLIVMTSAVVVSAIAIVLQALILFGMFRSVRSLKERVDEFIPRAEAILGKAEKSLDETVGEVKSLSARAMSLVDSAQKQVTRVDEVLGDVTVRAKTQLDRVELVLDDTVGRVHETVVRLNNGVLRPVKEINGVAAGLRAAIQQLARSRRPSVAQATSDEEMFI